MSMQLPLTVPRVSAPAASKQDELSLLALAFASVRRDAAAIRKAMVARRATMSTREDLPWDVGMDHLAEQASPPWVPRGW